MNRNNTIVGIDKEIFQTLLKEAQNRHREFNEPIPNANKDSLDKVEACLLLPFQTANQKYCYKCFTSKASILFYALIKNHCLQNGNKRMAVLSLGYFFYLNERMFLLSNDEIYRLAKITALSTNKTKSINKIHKSLMQSAKYKFPNAFSLHGLLKIKKSSKLRRLLYIQKAKLKMQTLLAK